MTIELTEDGTHGQASTITVHPVDDNTYVAVQIHRIAGDNTADIVQVALTHDQTIELVAALHDLVAPTLDEHQGEELPPPTA